MKKIINICLFISLLFTLNCGFKVINKSQLNNFTIKDGSAASGDERFTIVDGTGKVGINSTSPGERLDVSGAILTRSSFNNTAKFQHNSWQFQTTGSGHIDHETTNQDINFRVTKSSTSDTTMVNIDASAEQTKFHKIITVGLQGGSDTTQIGGGSGIGAEITKDFIQQGAKVSCVPVSYTHLTLPTKA